MEYNLIETAVIPEVPKVIPNEQLYVYVPVAAKDVAGIVLFDENDFDIINGKVFLKNTYLTIDSIEAGGNITINKENGKIIISASIAGIVQETGTGTNVAMSQDATTKALTALNNSLNASISGQIGALNVQLSNKIAETNNNVADINSKIPTQATADNKLADKAFVNSSVQTATANFRGNWSTWSTVPTNGADYPTAYDGTKIPHVNDYLVVQDASGYVPEHYTLKGTWRFKYSGTWATEGKNGWLPEYQVNEEPLTSEQLAALNSGITSNLVTDITTIKNNYVIVDETYTVSSAMWSDLSGNTPYKYMASVTATYTIGDETEVGIINDQPVAFANYGFVVGSVSNQTVVIFAIDKPTAEINLSVRYRG